MSSGRNITIQQDVTAKTEPVTEGRLFMAGVVEVNVAFAHRYAQLQADIALGPNGFHGTRSLVHGGPAFDATTRSGAGLRLGSHSVLFQSHVGKRVTIGDRSLVQASNLPDGAVVPPRTVVVGGAVAGAVEW